MSQPKVSIIVPVYNVEKYLRECVDSILGQSFADFGRRMPVRRRIDTGIQDGGNRQ